MTRAIAASLLLQVLLFGSVSHARAQEAVTPDQVRREYVRVTYYVLPGRMADGAQVHRDAAACSSWIPFGTQLMLPDGYIVTCEDRGHGDWYWRGWIDIWSPSHAWGRDNVEAAYGPYAWVEVVRWGWEDA